MPREPVGVPTVRVAVIDDFQRVAREYADWSTLGDDVSVEFFHDHLADEDALAERLLPYDVVAIMRERTPFRRSLLERLPNLKLLATTGPRNLSVDLQACADKGIVVSGTPSSKYGTVELTWALILSLARNVPAEQRSLREGRWQTTVGTTLGGKTLGILGLGNLGSLVAKVGAAFGMSIVAWSQNLTAERAQAAGATLVDKETLFATSDVLTIHLVLSDRTRGIVGAAELNRMKPTAYLVNTSRGPIVDHDALIEALRTNRIAGAGIDVFDREPIPLDHPILGAPNTVLTPHLGYVVDDGYALFYNGLVESIAAWRAGAPIRVLTPSPA